MTVRSALQINMHPLDARHVAHTLGHELEVWGRQVERVTLTIDTKRSLTGRYRGASYDENRKQLFDHIETFAARFSNLEIVEVDYSPEAREAVRRRYFDSSADVPEKAYDGGPLHAYFYGLLRADADYILHMDSDMLFGGGSQAWLDEAIGWFEQTPRCAIRQSIARTPTVDGALADLHRYFPEATRCRDRRALAADYLGLWFP
ncbi:glycosyltransferase family 2 protein [Methylosinus sp. H3A]|uniref:glycosyltransferase family A protein n=1 Tax=Methylosinus sp. H3A TaxID=2785786 RepID=UPI0018C2DC74|nr:glycosyltransferase family A protein [Methylosinus sp. H3A]MBG0812571.1 glycosyltransferase family 2 protein [Methylosinus sp. H3A]